MMSFLKNHPFAVEANFKRSIVLTFSVPKSQLENMIPACLELDTFADKWAFIAVALVDTTELRPKGFPTFLGNDFFLIGYRVFVRYINKSGKRLRGLYILKSETNKKTMEYMGNIFTHYNYSTTDISQSIENGIYEIKSVKSKFNITIDNEEQNVRLPVGSPFADWKEARRFAGPLPFTFTYNSTEKSVLVVEGVRENWTPMPLHVVNYNVQFMNDLGIKDAVLANAFSIENIRYHWKKGRIESWIQ